MKLHDIGQKNILFERLSLELKIFFQLKGCLSNLESVERQNHRPKYQMIN